MSLTKTFVKRAMEILATCALARRRDEEHDIDVVLREARVVVTRGRGQDRKVETFDSIAEFRERKLPVLAEGDLVEVPGYMSARRAEKAREFFDPAVTILHRADRGNHDTGFELVPGYTGDQFQVGAIRLTQLRAGDAPKLYQHFLLQALKQEGPSLAVCAGDKVLFAKGGKVDQLEVRQGPKTGKRVKSVLSGHEFVARVPASEVQIDVVEMHEMPKDGRTDEEVERLYDGIGMISREFLEKIVVRKTPTLLGIETDRRAELRVQRFQKRARRAKIVRVRAWTPEGMIKMVAVVRPRYAMSADIVLPACNLKKEVCSKGDVIFGLTVEVCAETVRTNLQSMLSLPELFPLQEVKSWAVQYANQVVEDIVSGKMSDSVEKIEDDEASHEEISEDRREELLRRWAAIQLFEKGYDFRHSPSLAESTVKGHLRNLVTDVTSVSGLKISVPVPSAVNVQIVSNAFARMAGYSVEVARGELAYQEAMPFAVANDDDWLEMYESHGGHDSDDKFNLFYRLIAGVESIVVLRSPNDRGEYTVFAHRPGDYVPEQGFVPCDGMKVASPRYSYLLRKEMVNVLGLPQGKSQTIAGEYDGKSFLQDLDVAVRGTSPGAWVNTIMLWNSVFPETWRETRVCSLEAGIDACTQARVGGVKELFDLETSYLCQQIVDSKRAVDLSLYLALGCSFTLEQRKIVESRLVDGGVSRLVSEIKQYVEGRIQFVVDWAQANHQVPEKLVAHAPTGRDKSFLKSALTDFRVKVATLLKNNETPDTKLIERYVEETYQLVGADVPAFAWVVHWWRTSPQAGNKISDRILLNRKFIGDYLAAL